MRRWVDLVIPLLVLLGALALRVQDGPIIVELRNRVFDTYQRFDPRPYLQQPVRILDIDEDSLRSLGQWPWPRDLMARIVKRLTEARAAAIVLDILQQEPDRTGPESLLKQWQARPDFAALRDAVAKLPDPDAEYASALAGGPTVLAFSLNPTPGGRTPLCKVNFSFLGAADDDPNAYLFEVKGATAALPIFERAAAGNGSVNAPPDQDGIIRRAPLAVVYQGQRCGSLVAEALRVAQGRGNYIIKLSGANNEENFGKKTGIAAMRIGQFIVPVDATGEILLYDSNSRPERFISVAKFLAPDFDPSLLAGQIVLIGSTAEGLRDYKSTPLNPSVAGVEIHAQLLEQILGSQYLQRPDFAFGAEFVFLLVFGLALTLLIRPLGAFWSAVLSVVAIAFAIGASWYAFRHYGMLFDPVYPSLAAVAIYLSGSLLGYLRTERERRHVRQTFSMYLAPTVVEELTRGEEPVKLGGELRELTVMFSDIRDFTKIAEKLDPQELTHLINSILTPLTAAIHDDRGTIDKYIGDCIMAFWNAPIHDSAHARHALNAALAMRRALVLVNAKLGDEAKAAGKNPIEVGIGIGINTGPCSIGNMGSAQRMAYSALGDTVNLASRLESLTRSYGVHIIVGQDSAAEAPDMALLEIDRVQVKGRAQPLAVYTLLGAVRDGAFEELAAAQARFLAAYRTKAWATAGGELAACRALAPQLDELYDLFERRISDYMREPPPPDWDGVFVAVSKAG